MTLPDPHQWDLLAQQLRHDVMAEIQRLKAARPTAPLTATSVEETTVQWCEDVLTLRNRLTQLQGKLTTMHHTASILQGKEPYGPSARVIRRVGDGN